MADDVRLLTTAEVARRLDVKPETVYAYVGRGQLRSIRSGRRRESLFDPDDVDRLVERTRQGRSPSGAIERIRTELTLLECDELYYRGRRATDLARTHSFESVAHLLWTDELTQPAPFEAPADMVDVVAAGIDRLPATVRLTDRIRVAVAVAAAADPLRYDLSPAAVVRRAESLLAVLVDTLPDSPPDPRNLASRL